MVSRPIRALRITRLADVGMPCVALILGVLFLLRAATAHQ